MKPFKTLVARTEREWKRSRRDLRGFPALAARLLTEFEYDWSRDRLDEELGRWLSTARTLPEQVSLHNTFGQPPITLFNDGRLVVDLYLWVAADTTLHSHGFRGAFRVLHGKSLQETYRVVVKRRIAPGVALCDPGTPERSILEPGDVRAILPGARLTHRVVHLERPTVTLCVKTINEPRLHQWDFHAGGLGIQRLDLDPDLIKKLYLFDYLLRENAARANRFLRDAVGSASVVMRMTLLEALSDGSLGLSGDAVGRCRAQVRRLHGKDDWFRRLESPRPLSDLHFAGCDSSLDRLIGHFVNEGCDPKTVAPLLSRLCGRDLTRSDVEASMQSLLDVDYLFGCALSPEDRATIKALVARPKERIPAHLEPFGQIRRMRRFVRMF